MRTDILLGNPAAYRKLLDHLTQTAAPSSGHELGGMSVDVEYYLGEDPLLTGFKLQVRPPRGHAPASEPLIQASAAWSLKGQGLELSQRAAFLEWVWTQRLCYSYADAHVISATPGAHLQLDAVTQIDADDFFVTLHVDVAP